MAKDIVMLHGASAGGWCFDQFRGVFESRDFTCHAPDLIGHGKDVADADAKLEASFLSPGRPHRLQAMQPIRISPYRSTFISGPLQYGQTLLLKESLSPLQGSL